MNCPVCDCPGAVLLLYTVSCFNPECQWYDDEAFEKADYDAKEKTFNGDSMYLIHEFLDPDVGVA